MFLPCHWSGHVIYMDFQFSCSVMSYSLRLHGLQYARLPCPSPPPRAYSNSCPLILWCHPTISSSAVPFSSCLQSLPASGSFPMSQFFAAAFIGYTVAVFIKVGKCFQEKQAPGKGCPRFSASALCAAESCWHGVLPTPFSLCHLATWECWPAGLVEGDRWSGSKTTGCTFLSVPVPLRVTPMIALLHNRDRDVWLQ